MKIVDKALITNSEVEKLQTAWYRYSSMKELLDTTINLSAMNSILKMYQEAYVEYNKVWNEILTKYFDNKYSGDRHSWSCDFGKREVIIEEN